MAKFWIRYGLGGGFGGCGDWEEIEAKDLESATNEAYISARGVYGSYGGMHGLANYEELEGKGYSYIEIEEIINEDFETWAIYEATGTKPKEV